MSVSAPCVNWTTQEFKMLNHVIKFHSLSCPPSLSYCTGCVIVSITGGSCPLEHIEVFSRVPETVPRYKIPFCLPPTNHHRIVPWWMSSSARPSSCMTAPTPPPIAVVRASGCINKRAKVRRTRWRWSSPWFTLCLQLQGFSSGWAVALRHPWCATLTPEVRPDVLNTWFDLDTIENMSFA